MNLSWEIIKLLFLFGVLGIAADFAVHNIKYIAGVLHVRLFAFGIVLGLVTSLPELSVGINAVMDGVASLSVGNLLGGIIVIFGLVLGFSLMFNRSVDTDGELKTLLPQIAYIILPIFLGVDGIFGWIDGLVLVFAYLLLIMYLYYVHSHFSFSQPVAINRNKIIQAFFLSIAGVVVVIVSAKWIVDMAVELSQGLHIGNVVLGAVVFAIGTNLPEITIAITSWRKKASELSLSHLLSSGLANVLILGILASLGPITFLYNVEFVLIAIFLLCMVFFFTLFYYSGKRMEAWEGLVLLVIYLLFLGGTFWLA